MDGEPFSPPDAKQRIQAILASGSVTFSKHALEELEADKMTTVDATNVLRGGWAEPAEEKNGDVPVPHLHAAHVCCRRVPFRERDPRNYRVAGENPMNCSECGGTMTTRIENNYRYTASGLSNVVLVGIEIRSCACGEEEVVIPRIESLHLAIATAILSKRSRLAAEEVRFLRKVMGLSGVDFAARMGVDPATVSRWENGHDTIGRQADGLLRLMVALETPKVDYHSEELAKIRDEVKPAAAVRLAPRSRGWAEAGASA